MKMRPAMFTWTADGTMVPHTRFQAICDRQFAVGAEYPLAVVEARSMKSHNHYFACIHTAWENLPEATAKEYPTAEHLRARALIETGFYMEKNHVCKSHAIALRLAAIVRGYTEFSVIKVSGNVVKVFDARSQSIAAMGNEDFKASKEAVLDWVQVLNPALELREIKKEASRLAPPEKRPSLSAATAPKQIATPAAALPTTAPAYFAFARTWIMAAQSRDAATIRWEAERTLRDDLRVSIPNRRQLEAMLEKQFDEEGVAR